MGARFKCVDLCKIIRYLHNRLVFIINISFVLLKFLKFEIYLKFKTKQSVYFSDYKGYMIIFEIILDFTSCICSITKSIEIQKLIIKLCCIIIIEKLHDKNVYTI